MSEFQATKTPENANETCVGPQSDNAGKVDSCAGCPNQKACASGAPKQADPAVGQVADRLAQVKHKLLVLSGKGGVGKSTFACQLAFSLAKRGYQVGLLDVDICGPSVPTMLGLVGQEVHQSASGWSPVYVGDRLGVMSIGFMLPRQDDAVIWRGPRKNGLIRQFLTDVDWGHLDYLVVDTPPGTSDEHISIVQYLKGAGVDGAVVVTTPQEVAMADVRKELSFCAKTGLPVVGLVENMSGLQLPVADLRFADRASGEDRTAAARRLLRERCPEVLEMVAGCAVFPAGNGGGPAGMARRLGARYLGALPLDPRLAAAAEAGEPLAGPLLPDEDDEEGETQESAPSPPAARPLEDIVDKVVSAMEEVARSKTTA